LPVRDRRFDRVGVVIIGDVFGGLIPLSELIVGLFNNIDGVLFAGDNALLPFLFRYNEARLTDIFVINKLVCRFTVIVRNTGTVSRPVIAPFIKALVLTRNGYQRRVVPLIG
jgi:hypothetical protein